MALRCVEADAKGADSGISCTDSEVSDAKFEVERC